jgi:hypothetical protein
MKRQIYLDAYIFRELECYIRMLQEIVYYGDGLGAIAHSEHGTVSASTAQLLYDHGAVPTSMDRLNSHVGNKLLQTHPVSVRKAAPGRECGGIVLFEEVHEKTDEWAFLVHYPRGYVDVQIHSVLGWTDGLEVSSP